MPIPQPNRYSIYTSKKQAEADAAAIRRWESDGFTYLVVQVDRPDRFWFTIEAYDETGKHLGAL